MDDHDCRDFCYADLEKSIRTLVNKFSGNVETIYFHQDADILQRAVTKHLNDDNEVIRHRVMVSFCVSCTRKRSSEVPSDEASTASPGLHSNGGVSEQGSEIIDVTSNSPLLGFEQPIPDNATETTETTIVEIKTEPTENFVGESESMDYEVLANSELKSMLEDIISNVHEEEEVESQTQTQGSSQEYSCTGLLTLTSEELHSTINNQLSKTSPNKATDDGEWKSPLFSKVTARANATDIGRSVEKSFSTVTIKQEADVPYFKTEGAQQCHTSQYYSPCSVGTYAPSTSASTQSTGAFTSTPSSFGMQQQYIPQVTVPMSAVNQVAYAMAAAASQKQIFRPANLPAVSSLVGGNGVASLNWALARASANNSATIINVKNQKFLQPGNITFVSARPSVLLPRSRTIHLSNATHQPLSTVIEKIRSRKTSPLVNVDSKRDSFASFRPYKEDVISQFANLPRTEFRELPEGHTYESFILQEGLHKVRKLGLHRKANKDEYPFRCPLCEKKYRNPNGIKYHAKYAHGPKSTFTCQVCQRDYATRHGLSAHSRTHRIADTSAPLESTTQTKSPKKVMKTKNTETIIIQQLT